MTAVINHSRFIKLLTERFPEVVAKIDDCDEGLLHLEMATFARVTQGAINNGDWERVKSYFTFADEVFRDSDSDVKNAVNVSYLENLYFGGRNPNRSKARPLLPPRLSQALIELEEYLENLFTEGLSSGTP